MGNDSEDGSIKYRFSSEGSDEVIAAAKKMVDELNATAAAMRKLAEEGKKAKKDGGLASSAGLSDEVRRIRDIRRTYESELSELRRTYRNSFSGAPNDQQARREEQLLRHIRRTERLEVRQHARETHAAESLAMGEQRQHVRWISNAMRMIGLGKYSPTGSTGATILGTMNALGVPNTTTAAGGIGAVGVGGLVLGGGMAAIGAATLWGNNRTLGMNPDHKIGMEIAGYVNPFESMEKTRAISKALQLYEYAKSRTATAIAGGTSSLITDVAGIGSAVMNSGSYLKNIAQSNLLPRAVRKAIHRVDTDEELLAAEKKATADAQARMDAAYTRTTKAINTPGISELRFMAGMTGPMMNEFLPQSEFGKKGLYASEGEGIAARSAYVWQDQLIKVLSQLGVTMDSIIKEARESRANGSKL